MKYNFNFKLLFYFFTIVAITASCGLKYDPLPLNEHTLETRRQVLQNTLKKEFEKEGETYVSLAFGESIIEKPASYRKLDSLFQLKYYASQNGLNTEVYDNQIEMQQAIIQTDTFEIQYIETNFFELRTIDTMEFIIAECKLNGKNELISLSLLDRFYTNKSNERLAQIYMKEDNFSGYAPNQREEDLQFYAFMKSHAAELIGKEHTDFMAHIFRLMHIAELDHTVRYNNFIRRLAENQFTTAFPTEKIMDYTFEIEKVANRSKYTEDFYEVTVRKTIEKTPMAIYQYNIYLLPIKIQ